MTKQTKQFFILRDDQHRERCIDFLRKTVCDGKTCVEVKKYTKNRSNAQNRLYWAYINAMHGDCGYTQGELHELLKVRLLGTYEKEVDGKTLVYPVSTTGLKTNEFGDYLRGIEQLAARMDIALPVPDDYQHAMG